MGLDLGFKLLDDMTLERVLDEKLRKIGYRLGVYPEVERFASEYDVPILPLGSGTAFVLRLVQDWDQQWSFGLLIRGNDICREIDFDRTRHYDRSCYHVWIDEIVRAVKRESSGRP